MSVADQVRAEERAARDQLRRGDRLQRAASRARDQQWRQRLTTAIRETRHRHPRCSCPLHAGMTRHDIQALGGGCMDPQYVCPRLDAIRRRLGL